MYEELFQEVNLDLKKVLLSKTDHSSNLISAAGKVMTSGNLLHVLFERTVRDILKSQTIQFVGSQVQISELDRLKGEHDLAIKEFHEAVENYNKSTI